MFHHVMALVSAHKTIYPYASVTKDQAWLDRHTQTENVYAKENSQQHGTDGI
jgi:hypothetical protein